MTAIPGVIAAGQKWTKVWEAVGNNADGLLADKNGDMLIAQNHNSKVVKLDGAGKVSTVFSDTHTGGALAISKKGDMFMVQRGLRQNVSQMQPTRKILATTLPNGDPLDCLGGVINDLTADSRGGVYFTMGGLFHADAKGTVTRYGEGLATNGVILSPDEKTLYVTNAGTVAAFDVQPDGSLKNQRQFVQLPVAGGDGLTVDSEGRLYVTAGAGVHVVAPDGKLLGTHSRALRPHLRGVRREGQENAVRHLEPQRREPAAARLRLHDPDAGIGIQGAGEIKRNSNSQPPTPNSQLPTPNSQTFSLGVWALGIGS